MKENNIFNKIINFFKNIFRNQKKLPPVSNVENNSQEKSNISPIQTTQNSVEKADKKQFLDMYEKVKKGEVDILSIDPDETEKICMLLEEEIKLKEKLLDKKMSQISEIEENIKKLKESA